MVVPDFDAPDANAMWKIIKDQGPK